MTWRKRRNLSRTHTFCKKHRMANKMNLAIDDLALSDCSFFLSLPLPFRLQKPTIKFEKCININLSQASCCFIINTKNWKSPNGNYGLKMCVHKCSECTPKINSFDEFINQNSTCVKCCASAAVWLNPKPMSPRQLKRWNKSFIHFTKHEISLQLRTKAHVSHWMLYDIQLVGASCVA